MPDSALSEYHSVLPAAFNQEERLLRLENELAKQARYTQEQAEWAQKKVAAIADTVGESIRQLQATMLGDKAELQVPDSIAHLIPPYMEYTALHTMTRDRTL